MISPSSLKVSRGSAHRMKLSLEERFPHHLDFILMALDLVRSLMKLMQLFSGDWIKLCNWVRLCNGWRASKRIPMSQGECHLCRFVRNKLPLFINGRWYLVILHAPKACAPRFKARQNLRPICEKQNVKGNNYTYIIIISYRPKQFGSSTFPTSPT